MTELIFAAAKLELKAFQNECFNVFAKELLDICNCIILTECKTMSNQAILGKRLMVATITTNQGLMEYYGSFDGKGYMSISRNLGLETLDSVFPPSTQVTLRHQPRNLPCLL